MYFAIIGIISLFVFLEMFNKDIVAGLYKFIEALLTAVAIAAGYALSMIMIGGLK